MAKDPVPSIATTLPKRGNLTGHDVITALDKKDGTLASREQRVANFVKENLDHISTMTIAELAENAGVSTPTVIRFCRSLGCDGFREFKLRLAQNLAVSLQYLEGTGEDQAPKADNALDMVLASVYATANIMRRQIDNDRLEEMQLAIAKSRQLLICGVGGGSSMIAEEAANRFFRLGIPAIATSDSYIMQMRAATLTQEDALLMVSASGEVDSIIAATRIASSYGARTIAMTRSGSTLSKVVDIPVVVDMPEDPNIFKPTATRHANLAILDAVAMMVAHTRYQVTVDSLRRIRSSLTAYHGRTGPQPLGD